MRSVVTARRQEGSVILTVCMLLLFLLGFMGIGLDFGHLFVVKTELQTAMDACALSAAQELDGTSDALARGTSAGITAGNLNRVNFQSAAWSGQGQITAADITFLNSAYVPTTTPSTAKYARCQHSQPSVRMWLLHILGGAVSGNSAEFPQTQSVWAQAVATRSSAQTTCPLPVGMKPKTGGTPPNYGFTVGEWVTLLMAPGAATNGEIGWANLDGSSSAAETTKEMEASCGVKVGDNLGTPGVQASIVPVWNARFGIYKSSGDPAVHHPDYTGYAYTSVNWPNAQSAYDGTPGGASTAQNFVANRLNFASCGASVGECQTITGLSLNSFTTMLPGGASATGGFKTYGNDRRLVTVPIVNGSQITDYACMLMLQPLTLPMSDTKLEFRGNAADPTSPCTTSGAAGGAAGPLVAVLVR